MHARRNAISIDMNDEMANAREGVVYFWANMNEMSIFDTVTTFCGINKLGLLGTAYNIHNSVYYVRDGDLNQSVLGQLREWCSSFTKSIFEKIGYGSDGDGVMGYISNILLKNIAPFVGDIVGGIYGLYTFGKALYQKIELWWQARKVSLRQGHPQTIAKAIGTLINNSMLEGLYALVKATVSASLKFITLGVSTIVNAIVGVIESIVRLIYAFKERKYINNFIRKCKEYWILPKSARIFALSGSAHGFNEEFLEATENSPVIGAITFSSNIAGDKHRFLKVYADDGTAISESQFKAGCKYLDNLKEIGRGYSKAWAEGLSSNDQVIKGLLRIVIEGKHALYKKKSWYQFWKTDKNTYSYGT